MLIVVETVLALDVGGVGVSGVVAIDPPPPSILSFNASHLPFEHEPGEQRLGRAQQRDGEEHGGKGRGFPSGGG